MIITIPDQIVKKDIKRLVNQMWKLIPMRENEENWLDQLDSLIVEIAGLYEFSTTDERFLILISKLKGLRVEETKFVIYRKTIFECISLLMELRL